MFTSSNSRSEVSIRCDSWANVNITPFILDLTTKHTINRSCIFGNKSQLQVSIMEAMPKEVKVPRSKGGL